MTNEEKKIDIWKLIYELMVMEPVIVRLCNEDRNETLRDTSSHIHELKFTLEIIAEMAECAECDLSEAMRDEEETKIWIEEVLPEVKLDLDNYLSSLTEEEYLDRLEEDQSDAEFWCERWEDVTNRVVCLMQAE